MKEKEYNVTKKAQILHEAFPKEEILPVSNPYGEIIDAELYSKVHSGNWEFKKIGRIEKIRVVILTLDGEILIPKRGKKPRHPDKLELPGGHLQYDVLNNRFETPIETLSRELFEELGITLESLELVTSVNFNYQGDKEQHHLNYKTTNFIAICNKNTLEVKPDSAEVKEYYYVPFFAISDLSVSFVPGTQEFLENNLNNFNNLVSVYQDIEI